MIADISTRWNSSYYAWTRLVKVKGYIQTLLPELENDSDPSARKDGKYLRSIMLSLDEWDLLQELIIVLAPFEQATRHLGGEKYVTHSIMYPLIKEIKRQLSSPSSSYLSTISNMSSTSDQLENFETIEEVFILAAEVEELENEDINEENSQKKQNRIDLNKSLNTNGILEKVKKNLYDAMCFYWQFLSEDYMISTLLDPRIKHVNDEDEEMLRQKYEDYQDQLQTPLESRPVSPTPSEQFSINITSQSSIFAIFEQNQPKVHDEVTEYLQEDIIPFNQNPFEWWANKKIKYPVLAKIARIYLVVPATSTPSERLFSDAGNLLSAKRSRMDAELFKRMIFLKKNIFKVNSIHSSI